MKSICCKIRFACAALTLLSAACTSDPAETGLEGTVAAPALRFCVSEMTMSETTRASQPMNPDLEKYVRTIAIFEFDNEGQHEKRSSTYHFVDFLRGTVDDVKGVGKVDSTEFGVVESTLEGLKFERRSDGTICLVANVTEEQVDDFYNEYREEGQSYGSITLDKFKTWALPFEYEQVKAGTYDETTAGHLKNMYMFGYYQGPIDPESPEAISIDLGRLASRLDITVVNETGMKIEKRLGYHFDNVCSSAYFFPIKMGMPPKIGTGLTRTVICSGLLPDGTVDKVENAKTEVQPTFEVGKSHTRYFYVAAHSAQGYEEATQLHLFYDRRIVEGEDDPNDLSNNIRIPLCNIHPLEAGSVTNGYSLSRNTRYHFTIRLKKMGAASSDQSTRSVVFEDCPGEITVYLP